jgi:hypothetical protein
VVGSDQSCILEYFGGRLGERTMPDGVSGKFGEGVYLLHMHVVRLPWVIDCVLIFVSLG